MLGNIFQFTVEQIIEICNLVDYSMDLSLIYRLIHHLIEKIVRRSIFARARVPPAQGGTLGPSARARKCRDELLFQSKDELNGK